MKCDMKNPATTPAKEGLEYSFKSIESILIQCCFPVTSKHYIKELKFVRNKVVLVSLASKDKADAWGTEPYNDLIY